MYLLLGLSMPKVLLRDFADESHAQLLQRAGLIMLFRAINKENVGAKPIFAFVLFDEPDVGIGQVGVDGPLQEHLVVGLGLVHFLLEGVAGVVLAFEFCFGHDVDLTNI